jgi:hypothetical protein
LFYPQVRQEMVAAAGSNQRPPAPDPFLNREMESVCKSRQKSAGCFGPAISTFTLEHRKSGADLQLRQARH